MADTDEELKTKAQIKRHEGYSGDAYQDSLGFWTWGYGHLIGKTEPSVKTISKADAEMLFEADYQVAVSTARSLLFAWEAIGEARRGAMVNMAFNLGFSKLKQFAKTLSHIEGGRYKEAADEMLNSMWAKQVGSRAVELAAQMRTGEWQGAALRTRKSD
jgi:lysozyme